MSIDMEDYTQSVDDVVRAERLATYPLPLKVEDRRRLFDEWCGLNPDVLDEMELAALNIDARGLRVSAKYLTERQRYEGRVTEQDEEKAPRQRCCVSRNLSRYEIPSAYRNPSSL